MKNLLQIAVTLLGLIFSFKASAQGLPVTQYPLGSWSFYETNTWKNDGGYAPVSFTNLNFSTSGDYGSLVMDSTNAAWLKYNVYESDGTTNLTVDKGSATLWFAPSWGSLGTGGSGPGSWGQLIGAGQWTSNATYGWWSLYTDAAGTNLYFSAQNNAGTQANYLATPIAWTSNQWHFIALTYSSTNTALYLDGQLASTGAGMSVWPSSTVLANGFNIGSDTNGLWQAHGKFDDIYTYNFVLDSNTISSTLSLFKPAYYLLDSWSFYDTVGWTNDFGYAPVSFSHLNSTLGDGSALVLDTNMAAKLQYKVVESDGRTNLTVNQGSVTMWFAPSWSSANHFGTGPGVWGQLIGAGEYTSDASYGWWSLYVDSGGTNLLFSAQANDGSQTNYLTFPISWPANQWHFIALTYSSTNTALYLDGKLATNGIGMSVWPSSTVLSNGLYFGSDTNGAAQAHGIFDDIATFSIPLNAIAVSNLFENEAFPFKMDPLTTFANLSSATSSPSYTPIYDVITGSGNLLSVSNASFCDTSSNIWITNVTAQAVGSGTNITMNLTFTIAGGSNGLPYDVFATSALSTGTNSAPWAWMGQGYHCNVYTLTNLPSTACFLILGKPIDTDGDGLTDAYEKLVSHTDPNAFSTDGTGMGDGWEILYGMTGVDPYGDPDGDGWNNLQEAQNGTNPNSFNTPPAPHGLTVTFNGSSGAVYVSWLPSPGNVTGYTVTRYDYDMGGTTTFNVSSNSFSISDSVTNSPYYLIDLDIGDGPQIDMAYQIQAHYGSSGNSALSDAVLLEPNYSSSSSDGVVLPVSLIAGPQGTVYLAVAALPSGTAFVRVSRLDDFAHFDYSYDSFDTNFDIPVSAFTNGLYLLPSNLTTPSPDSYGVNENSWHVELIDTHNNPSESQDLTYGNFYIGNGGQDREWMVPPYFDGRVQLKQNLIFLLRSPNAVAPFQFVGKSTVVNNLYTYTIVTTSANCVYADFSQVNGVSSWYANGGVFAPFANNYLYQNFIYSTTNTDSCDAMITGVFYDIGNDFHTNFVGYGLALQEPQSYQFQSPSNGATISSFLATNGLYAPPLSVLYSRGETNDICISATTNYPPIWTLSSSAKNYWGLQYSSIKLVYGCDSNSILYPGDSFQTPDANVYIQTVQPGFQLVEYDFNMASSPGSTNFSTTNTSSPAIVTSVGNPFFGVSGYAKLAVTNSYYSGVYGYLGQYFDQAYKIDTNGIVTTNTTGILSSYGNFFATEPGPVALVTMPDPDTGARGTATVYTVSLVLDKNQGSNMDLSFGGADATSANNPDSIWVNNNYDRGHVVDGTDFEQDDLGPVDIASGHLFPDCLYITNGLPAIPCARDLEDYFRLWTPGLAAAMAAAPTNYTARLTLSGSGQIRIFQAIEPNGGTNYLFDETTASNQVANSSSLYVGLLTSGSPVVLNNRTNEHFIFCGVTNGSAQVDLQILDDNQNILADVPAYLQINDIKQMYERWTVGEVPGVAPKTIATYEVDNMAFQYTPPQDTNTPYILFVHGWNQETWEKDRYAEVVYKRLYWQGYQGRFGLYRWPTGNKFTGIISVLTDARNYDNSEYTAWRSATGLTNLLTKLDSEYPGNVYLLAHSMGNVVAGETLRQASSQLVNTYVAMQGAVPSHAYDPTATNRAIVAVAGIGGDDGTPNRYAEYYTNGAPCYFASSAGAGTYVNVYNATDYALAANLWQVDQNLKPDGGLSLPYPGYYYNSSSNFYRINGSIVTYLNFPTNTYEIFAYCDEARCYAIGAQANVGGVFKPGLTYQQVNSQSLWPADTHPNSTNSPYSEHVWHSAEFRSDNEQRALFWNTVLVRMGLK